MKEHLDDGSLGKLAFIEANFSNERALELTPDTWRWYRDRAPGGPLSQLAIHMFDILHYLGGDVEGVSSSVKVITVRQKLTTNLCQPFVSRMELLVM